MRKTLYKIGLFSLLILVFNCKKNSEDTAWMGLDHNKEYTIQDLKNIIDISKYNCGDTIVETGQYAYVLGYVQELNVDFNNSRFLLFSAKDNNIGTVFNQEVMDVKVNKSDSEHLFSTLVDGFKTISDTSYLYIRVKSEIYGWDMAGNGWCDKAIALVGHDIKIIK